MKNNDTLTFSNEEFSNVGRGLGANTAVQVEGVDGGRHVVWSSGVQDNAHQGYNRLYLRVFGGRLRCIWDSMGGKGCDEII